ncbi:MAG: hypothetical protein WCF90_09820, partial [Methanomicrobiales archaeon]
SGVHARDIMARFNQKPGTKSAFSLLKSPYRMSPHSMRSCVRLSVTTRLAAPPATLGEKPPLR